MRFSVWAASSSAGPSLYDLHAAARPSRRDRVDELRRSPRPRAVRRGLADPDSGVIDGAAAGTGPICVGPLTYIGSDAISGRHRQLQGGARAQPGRRRLHDRGRARQRLRGFGNTYYKSDEEFLYACAEAMREEYKAIVDAGLVLQLDDPAIARTGI